MLALLAGARVARPAAEPPVDALRHAVEAGSALALASRADVSLADWIAAAKALAPSTPQKPGLALETVPLTVLGKVESTEIAIYVPTRYAPGTPAPLLMAFHGTGGRGGDVVSMWQATAEALGMLVVAPTEAGPNDGYHFSARERASTFAALRWARLRFDVDEGRVFATGISRGGHLVWDAAARTPDVFAALAPMIGAPRVTTVQGGNNLRYLENLAGVPIRDLQGSKDDPHLVANLRLAFERLAAWKAVDARLLEFPERGHDFDFDAVDWTKFFGAAVRDPAPARVLRRCSSPAEGRAAWAEVLAVDPTTVGEDVRPIQPGGWDRMEDDAKRRFIAIEAEKRTARLEVLRVVPGRFEAHSSGVKQFRLRLRSEDLGTTGSVVVTWNGQSINRTVTPSKAVLLRDFVERFDRRFLPVVEITIP